MAFFFLTSGLADNRWVLIFYDSTKHEGSGNSALGCGKGGHSEWAGLGVSKKSLTAQWSVQMPAQETWNPDWSSAFGVFLGAQSDMIRAPPFSLLTGSALLLLPLKMRKLADVIALWNGALASVRLHWTISNWDPGLMLSQVLGTGSRVGDWALPSQNGREARIPRLLWPCQTGECSPAPWPH